VSFSAFRKRGTVEQEPTRDERYCDANGCPNRWSVNISGNLCTAHAWAEPHEWPAITEREQNRCFERQYREQPPAANEPVAPMTAEQKREVINAVREAMKAPVNHREWAHKLKARDDAGEPISLLQRAMYEGVLRGRV
jgi:hypothetical protein